MTGTGPFRGVPTPPRGFQVPRGGRTPAEEHLGDRLAAFVDGELRDDQRERVQAHLVTCPQCKAEADEQRRLKSAVAGAIPPAVSASLLARLQGLPGGDGGDPGGGAGDPFGPRGGLAGGRRGKSYLTPGRAGRPAGPGQPPDEGFRIHEQARGAPRSRRFAFAAAGAFSLAALALGGALPLDALLEGAGAFDVGTGVGAGAHADGQQGTAGEGRSLLPGVLTTPIAGVAPLTAARPLLSRREAPSPLDGLSPSPAEGMSGVVPVSPVAAPAPAPTAFTVAPSLPPPGVAPAQASPGR